MQAAQHIARDSGRATNYDATAYFRNGAMTMEHVLPDGSLVDPAIAALMESPEFQAQIAALTQQAAAQLAALVASLRQAEQQLPSPPAPTPHDDDTQIGIWPPPLEPIFFQPVEPKPSPAPGDAEAGAPRSEPPPFAHAAVMPTDEELAVDMLAVMPPVAPPHPALPTLQGGEPPSAAAASWPWTPEEPNHHGGEGGLF